MFNLKRARWQPIHTQKCKFKGQSVQKVEWKQMDGMMLPVALPSRLTWSVKMYYHFLVLWLLRFMRICRVFQRWLHSADQSIVGPRQPRTYVILHVYRPSVWHGCLPWQTHWWSVDAQFRSTAFTLGEPGLVPHPLTVFFPHRFWKRTFGINGTGFSGVRVLTVTPATVLMSEHKTVAEFCGQFWNLLSVPFKLCSNSLHVHICGVILRGCKWQKEISGTSGNPVVPQCSC